MSTYITPSQSSPQKSAQKSVQAYPAELTLGLQVAGYLNTGSRGSKSTRESENDHLLSLGVLGDVNFFGVREALEESGRRHLVSHGNVEGRGGSPDESGREGAAKRRFREEKGGRKLHFRRLAAVIVDCWLPTIDGRVRLTSPRRKISTHDWHHRGAQLIFQAVLAR